MTQPNCKFASKCCSFACTFQHPPERRAKCNFGARCNKPRHPTPGACKFLHPKAQKPADNSHKAYPLGSAASNSSKKSASSPVVKLQFSVSTADKKNKSVTLSSSRRQLCVAVSVDTSGSMCGSRMDYALEGLDSVARMVAPTDLFGLNTFSTTVKNLHYPMPMHRVKWDKDKQHVRNNLGGCTALWDAVAAGVDLLKEVLEKRKKDPKRFNLPKLCFQQLLLTDGMDNSSSTSFEQVKQLVKAPGLPDYHLVLVAVTSDMESAHVQKLAELCQPSHARLVECKDVGQLKKVLAAEAERLKLVVESYDPTGASGGFKGKVRSVTELKTDKFDLQKGLAHFVPSQVLRDLQNLQLK